MFVFYMSVFLIFLQQIVIRVFGTLGGGTAFHHVLLKTATRIAAIPENAYELHLVILVRVFV